MVTNEYRDKLKRQILYLMACDAHVFDNPVGVVEHSVLYKKICAAIDGADGGS